jgi:hypothetical protein
MLYMLLILYKFYMPYLFHPPLSFFSFHFNCSNMTTQAVCGLELRPDRITSDRLAGGGQNFLFYKKNKLVFVAHLASSPITCCNLFSGFHCA